MSVFSHSRIDTFETCPKKYEFSYLLKLPRGPEGIEAFMGSRVHDALEWLYGQVRACRVPAEDAVVGAYREAWESGLTPDVTVVRPDRTVGDYFAIGEKALREYYRRYHPFDQGVTVGLEQRIMLKLDDDHEVTGFIDRLVKVSDGVWEIHDYKTSASLLTQEKADADRQLALYELGVREMFPDAEKVVLVWHYLVFDHEVRSCRTPEQLADLRDQVLAQITFIEAQREFPTKVSKLCDWCDHKRVCPAWKHLFGTGEPSDSGREQVSGVQLVDDYVSITAEIAALKARQDEVREAIVAVAAAEGLDRVFGTDCAVKVYRYRQACVPDAKDPRRAEFEALVRELGLWDRFSSLSGYSVSKAWESAELPPEAVERLADYVTITDGVKLYTSKVT